MKIKTFLFLLFLINFYVVTVNAQSSQEEGLLYDNESHPLETLSPLVIATGSGDSLYYHTVTINEETVPKKLVFMKKKQLPPSGLIPISGYVIAKEFVEAHRSNPDKKEKLKFYQALNEKNPQKLLSFFLDQAELKDSERKFLPTGFIELAPVENSEGKERIFVALKDLKKKDMKIDLNQAKIQILKSITVYSFQSLQTGVNFGQIEDGDEADKLSRALEEVSKTICGAHCENNDLNQIGEFAADIGNIVSTEMAGDSRLENLEESNDYIFAQQICTIESMNSVCGSKELTQSVDQLKSSALIIKLIKRHESFKNVCAFVTKIK